jgi:hypothetical protein
LTYLLMVGYSWGSVTGRLICTVSSERSLEPTHLRLSITSETWATAKSIDRVAAQEIEAKCVASGMINSRVVRVLNTINRIQLNGFIGTDRRQGHYRLPNFPACFSPCFQWEHHGIIFNPHIAVSNRDFIKKWVAALSLWNYLYLKCREYSSSSNISDVFNKSSHITCTHPAIRITIKGLKKLWRTTIYNNGGILNLGHPNLFSAYNYVGYKIANSAQRYQSKEYYLYPSDRSRRLPALFKGFDVGLLFLIVGLLGMFGGFVVLFSCLCLGGSSRRALIIAIGVIGAFSVIFHQGLLWCL